MARQRAWHMACRQVVWRGEGAEERLAMCGGALRRAYVRVGDGGSWRAHPEVWGTVCDTCGWTLPDRTPTARPASAEETELYQRLNHEHMEREWKLLQAGAIYATEPMPPLRRADLERTADEG